MGTGVPEDLLGCWERIGEGGRGNPSSLDINQTAKCLYILERQFLMFTLYAST